MDFKDLKEQVLAHNNKLKKLIYIEDRCIVINTVGEYCIELDRCDTPEKLLEWVHHLCEKTWMTTDILARFIEVASVKNEMTLKHL